MTRAVSFRHLPQVPALFRDYAEDFDRMSHLFAGDYRNVADHLAEAERLANRVYSRDELSRRLVAENRRLGADEDARASIEAIGDDDTFVVVAGQQAGLYTGPLYSLYKALTTSALARSLNAEAGGRRRFIPLFWIASEDHDLEEINHVFLSSPDGPTKLTAPVRSSGVPAGLVRVDSEIREFERSLAEALPPSEYRDSTLEAVASRDGESLADWFGRVLLHLTRGTGIGIVDPAWIRDLAAPVFVRAARDHADLEAAVDRGQRRVRDAGYEPVLDRSDSLNLFRIVDGIRRRVKPEGDHMITEGNDKLQSREDFVSRIERSPEDFSANVVSRPLVQSWVLPVSTFVGGPSEIAYFAELRDAFDAFDVPMPRLFPRVSATLLTPRQHRTLLEFGIEDAELFGMAEEPPPTDEIPAELRDALARLRLATSRDLDDLARETGKIDANAEKTVAKLGSQVRQRVDKIERAALDSVERASGRGRERWRRLRGEILPKGRLQERVLGPVPFLVRFGASIPNTLLESFDVFDFRHQIVVLATASTKENVS